jgi:hypothetical protein
LCSGFVQRDVTGEQVKTGKFDPHVVGPAGQIGNPELPGSVAGNSSRGAGCRVDDGDCCADDDVTRGIADHARQLRAGRERLKMCHAQNHGQENDKYSFQLWILHGR